MPADPITTTTWILAWTAFTGPIIAVAITIISDRLRTKKQARLNIIQTILNTRQRPYDIQYQWAIMAVAIEFREDKTIMAAHLDYMRHVHLPFSPENAAAHDKTTGDKLSSLLKLLFSKVGSKMSEADIESLSYYTVGVGNRERLLEDALTGIVRMADYLDKRPGG